MLASLSKSYYVFLTNDVQLHDVIGFVVSNGVLSLDTTFNICKNWITNSCYHNQRLQNNVYQHPVLLGHSLIHCDSSRYGNLKRFCRPDTWSKASFMCLSSAKNDAQKIRELVRQKGALKNIICDIYGHTYGGVKELGLVDSTNMDDFQIKLESLKSVWDNLCPGFRQWFSKKWAPFLRKASLKVHEQVSKYRECIKTIRLNSNNSGKKWSSPIKNQLWQT